MNNATRTLATRARAISPTTRKLVFVARPTEERFWGRVNKQEGGCWLWLGAKNAKGYGSFCASPGVTMPSHRWSWEQRRGPVAAGLQLDHLCRNPSCVNPSHLEPVTHHENQRRGRNGVLRVRATHCRHGHEYTLANSGRQRQPDGSHTRFCRECRARVRHAREARQA